MKMGMGKAIWFGTTEPTDAEREGARLRGTEICAIPEGMALAGEDLSSLATCRRVVEALRGLAQREGAVEFYTTLSCGVFPKDVQHGLELNILNGKKLGLLASVYASNGEFLGWDDVVGAI